MRRPVVITGMGIVTAQGAGKETNWTTTVSGEPALRPVTLFDTPGTGRILPARCAIFL